MDETAVFVCGHGSRDPDAIREFELVAKGIRQRLPHYDVETGYLEFARPIIHEGLKKLVDRGAKHILALPGMLFAAAHVKNDLPWELNSFVAANPGIRIAFGRELAIEPKLLRASAERIAASIAGAKGAVSLQDSLLVVVGRGTNDPDANSNVAKVTRMLWEGMGFGWAETAYSGVAHPRVDEALERAVRLGFRRIIVFPYFLFTGILVKRIYSQTDAVAERHPEIEFVKAGYLKDHALVLDSFADRVEEILAGDNRMNCQLCKYREQLVGYEAELGARQEGHHHHVRGLGTDAEPGHALHRHGNGHGHHHGDGYDHHHHHHHGPNDKAR
ncbi:MAG: sirohydrochlorin chelatase [Proteobacteria bacterium]|nr:sirohydrochlorin chelatase [Pseudomonadota bacterium]